MPKTTKEQIDLDSYQDIRKALKHGPVYCDIVTPNAKHIPVRDTRKFNPDRSLRMVDIKDPKWTDLCYIGQQKGYEVLTLEGWHVPERVYLERQIPERTTANGN
jgi:hypothetical protein